MTTWNEACSPSFNWQFIVSSASVRIPRYASPDFNSTVTIWLSASCRSLMGTPAVLVDIGLSSTVFWNWVNASLTAGNNRPMPPLCTLNAFQSGYDVWSREQGRAESALGNSARLCSLSALLRLKMMITDHRADHCISEQITASQQHIAAIFFLFISKFLIIVLLHSSYSWAVPLLLLRYAVFVLVLKPLLYYSFQDVFYGLRSSAISPPTSFSCQLGGTVSSCSRGCGCLWFLGWSSPSSSPKSAACAPLCLLDC